MLILKAIRSVLAMLLLGICVLVMIAYFVREHISNLELMLSLLVLIGTVHTYITNKEADAE